MWQGKKNARCCPVERICLPCTKAQSVSAWLGPILAAEPQSLIPPTHNTPVISLPKPPEQPKRGQPLRVSPSFLAKPVKADKGLWSQASTGVNVHAGTGEGPGPSLHFYSCNSAACGTVQHPAVHGHTPAMPQADIGQSIHHPEVTPGMPTRLRIQNESWHSCNKPKTKLNCRIPPFYHGQLKVFRSSCSQLILVITLMWGGRKIVYWMATSAAKDGSATHLPPLKSCCSV